MTIEQFVDESAKPIYAMRMAKHGLRLETPMGVSCRKRYEKAEKELRDLIHAFIEDEYLD